MKPGNIRRNMLLTAFSYFFVPLAGLATAPILAQNLGVDGRGAVAAAIAPLNLSVALFSLGLPQSMVHYVAKYAASLRGLYRSVILVQIVSGLLGVLILFLLAPYLSGQRDDITKLICISTALLPFSLLTGLIRGIASGFHQWSLVTVERCLTEFTKVTTLIVLMLIGNLTVLTAVMVMVVSPILSAFIYLWLTRLNISQELEELKPPGLRSILSFGARIWFGSLSGLLLTRVSQVLMTPLSSVSQLGYFVAATNVSDVALLANNAVRDVTLASDSADAQTKRATTSARCSFLISIIVGVFLIGSLKLWFTKVFGQSFQPSEVLVVVLVVANVLGVPGSVAGAVLSARGFPGRRSFSLVIAAIVNLVTLLILLPTLGAMGAAIAALVGNLIAANLNIVFAYMLLKIKPGEFYLIRFSDVEVVYKYLFSMIRR
ncbi:oligosaccharide flippase family protein [Glutamicibacter arilaitensis]|uniref:oligosaccharide flippase family protein n=1 Tax=Glutamicibacter arilaitensis TaxID=256701 RepID=UPI003FD1DD88